MNSDVAGFRHQQRIIDSLCVTSQHSALDLGCGDGSYLKCLADGDAFRIVGLDLSLTTLIGVATRKRAWMGSARPRITLVCGDATKMPLADASVDRVVCALVLYLVPVEDGLRELSRVLAFGGRAYIRVPMLSWTRAFKILTTSSIRKSAYTAAHVASGVVFAVTGRQRRNLLLRNDQWALHVPEKRLRATIAKVGLSIERLEITRSVSGAPSIDAWIVKP